MVLNEDLSTVKNAKQNHSFYEQIILLLNSHNPKNNIVSFAKNSQNNPNILKTKNAQSNLSGNEIFLCFLVVTIFVVHLGSSALIQHRTKQQFIYNLVSEISNKPQT